MADALFELPVPSNEPVRAYAPGDAHRASLKARLASMASERVEIPIVIGGKEIRTGNKSKVTMPHAHQEVLGEYHMAGPEEMRAAAQAALKAKADWENMPWQDRASIFLKAADLLAGPWRDTMNAATMLGQSKSAFQAEIDSACELIDFLRFNGYFYQEILRQQPFSSPGIWNRMEYRPLEGFVLAITPFNFTAIAGNLPTSPAICGNTVVWKPSSTQMLAAHHWIRLLKEAGLPDGVINMIPCRGSSVGQVLLPMREFAGIHFTGSTGTMNSIWKTISENISGYATYPRVVGETGGKDFVFAHASADIDALAAALVRGSFEYQGQKCSAASRAYIPRSVWKKLEGRVLEEIRTIRMGDVRDFRNFVNAVIDEAAFKSISGYLEFARKSGDEAKILIGGKADGSKGWFVEPTVIQTTNPRYKTMVEEIFGPVLTVYVYDDNRLDETLQLCDETSPYSLTGAVFAQDRQAIVKMAHRLRNSSGNFYINDKPTGAVVGQQPFGGARGSGTNDKAGSALNLYRWISARSIKETLVPPRDYRYPFLGAE
jgi:1-pyrroline-5-carboxylate dehydrogenase